MLPTIAIISLTLTAVLSAVKLCNKLTAGWCRCNVCLVGRTVIVTGANSGIGYETAQNLAMRGARVILACRDPTKGKEAECRIKQATNNENVLYKHLDLASLESVRRFAADIIKTEQRLDILVNNAGVLNLGSQRSEDGLLLLMLINYFGPFLLTNLLLDVLKKTPNSRVVNVTSHLAKWAKLEKLTVENLNEAPKSLHFLTVYQRSKVCLSLFTVELAHRLKGTGVSVFAAHPGEVSTKLYETLPPGVRFLGFNVFGKFVKNALEGSQTVIHCCVAPGIQSGGHFSDCKRVRWFQHLENPQLPGKLWETSLIHVKMDKSR